MSVLEPELSNGEEEPKTPRCKMLLLCFLITMPSLLGGMVESYSAVALPQMHLTIDQASLFGSVHGFASPIGAVLFGLFIDLYGRKFTIVVGVLPFLVGWLLICWNRNIYVSILGKFINGISTGTFFYPIQVYTVECIAVNDGRLRSNFATWCITANAFGISVVFLFNAFSLSQQIPAFAASLAFILLVLIYLIIPESPTWLFLNGRVEDATVVEKKLGIFQPILHEAPTSAIDAVDGDVKSVWSKLFRRFEMLKREDIYKPLLIMTVFVVLFNCTGGFALLAYMMDIIGTKPSDGNVAKTAETQNPVSFQYNIITGAIVCVAHLLTSLTLHLVGTKRLGVITALFLCLGYAIMGFASVAQYPFLNRNSFYINLAGVWLVTFAFHLGVYAVPLTIMGVVFPSDAKGIAGFPILVSNLVNGVVIELHPYLYVILGGYLYFGYFLIGIVYAVFVIYFVPETVGKTFDQIIKQFW